MCCRWNNICMYIAFWWYYNINTFWSFLYIQRRRIILRPLLTLYIIVCVLTYFILLIFEPQQTIVERIFDSFTLGYASFAIIVLYCILFCLCCISFTTFLRRCIMIPLLKLYFIVMTISWFVELCFSSDKSLPERLWSVFVWGTVGFFITIVCIVVYAFIMEYIF